MSFTRIAGGGVFQNMAPSNITDWSNDLCLWPSDEELIADVFEYVLDEARRYGGVSGKPSDLGITSKYTVRLIERADATMDGGETDYFIDN